MYEAFYKNLKTGEYIRVSDPKDPRLNTGVWEQVWRSEYDLFLRVKKPEDMLRRVDNVVMCHNAWRNSQPRDDVLKLLGEK